MPPQSTVVLVNTLPAAQAPVADELELDVLEEALLVLELELLVLDELLEAVLELDDDEVPLGAEHSFTPPETLLPVPNVSSLQTKLPESVL